MAVLTVPVQWQSASRIKEITPSLTALTGHLWAGLTPRCSFPKAIIQPLRSILMGQRYAVRDGVAVRRRRANVRFGEPFNKRWFLEGYVLARLQTSSAIYHRDYS